MPKVHGLRRLLPVSRLVRLAFILTSLVLVTTLYLYIVPPTQSSTFSPPEAVDAPILADESALDAAAASKPDLPSFLPPVDVRIPQPVDPVTGRANATLVMLARNSDVDGAVYAIRSLEDRFNRRLSKLYPWVFLNEVPFDEEFKRRVSEAASGEVQFGLVKSEEWYQPDWIDEKLVEEGKEWLKTRPEPWPIPYANSTSYRNMCRYNSGFFYKHELLAPYKWYWRVEPEVEFTCPIEFDPFVYMIENNKRYSFVVSLEEIKATVLSLWDTVKDFREEYPGIVAEDNALPFISDDGGETYNYCHFWSNFEIADLDFFRSDAYAAYFDYLDATGNFYYERWGDAPVHSIAAALMLPRSQLHFFGEIGYYHAPLQYCPLYSEYKQLSVKCSCKMRVSNINFHSGSCLTKFSSLYPPGERG